MEFEWKSSLVRTQNYAQRSNSVLSGKYASSLRGRGLDFEESRPYVLGDDIRNIDWNVTAKTGKTHSKVFTEEKEKPAFIIVDQSPTMGFGSKNKTKSVVAAELAAFFAYKVRKAGDRVGGLVFKGQSYDLLPPRRSRQNVLDFLQMITEANHRIYDNAETPDYTLALQEVMAKLHRIITHDYFVVVISDFIRYSPEVLQYMCQLAIHNNLILFKVMDTMERQMPKDRITITDKKRQAILNNKDQAVRNALLEDFDLRLTDFQKELNKYSIPMFTVNTLEPALDQLTEILTKP